MRTLAPADVVPELNSTEPDEPATTAFAERKTTAPEEVARLEPLVPPAVECAVSDITTTLPPVVPKPTTRLMLPDLPPVAKPVDSRMLPVLPFAASPV